jgi:hypothetical protein
MPPDQGTHQNILEPMIGLILPILVLRCHHTLHVSSEPFKKQYSANEIDVFSELI